MSIKLRRLSEEPGIDEQEEGYGGVNSVWVVLKRTDLAGFSSRIFRMEPGGQTPMHAHDREHVAIVTRGTCRVESDLEVLDANEGSIITIPASASHRFINPGPERSVILIMNLFTVPSSLELEAATYIEP